MPLTLVFTSCSQSELKFPQSQTSLKISDCNGQWWSIFQSLKLSFSEVPLKPDFSMYFVLPDIACMQFLLAHRNSLKWNPWIFLWNTFFSETDCHGSYLEPISLCSRAEWCTFPSIRLQVGQAFSHQAKLGESRASRSLFVLRPPETTSEVLELMNVQHTEAPCMNQGSLAFRKNFSHCVEVLSLWYLT